MTTDKQEFKSLELWYGPILVGQIINAFDGGCCWWGILELTLDAGVGELQRQLAEFIHFCEDWNERQLDDTSDCQVSDFDPYRHFWEPGEWFTRSPQGVVQPIDGPVFFQGGDVTWATRK